MTLSLRLSHSQRQTLAMTPQLMQAIKLLQMSNLEVEAAVRDEVDRNPLLTLTARPAPGGAAGGRVAVRREGFRDGPFDPTSVVAARLTLAEHAAREAASLGLDREGWAIAHYLIGSLDDDGRIAPEVEVEAVADLGVAPAAVAATLARLQTIEPAGLFARSLTECLALQLQARGELCTTARAVLDNLTLVARRDVRRLAEIAGTSEGDVVAALARLRTLDPRPGLGFDAAPVQAIEPDVVVRRRADGGFLVVLDTQRLPRVLVDTEYHAEISATGDPAATTFAKECLRSAHWLTRSLDQRARTIVKVASAIVTRQRPFFEGAARHVSPLTLREIAEDIGMHESTVSRVVCNKAMATDRGVFPFRAFFAVAIDAADGAVSSDAVRAKIRQIVDAETPATVRSDDEIVRTLKTGGIVIARRTVAKYREAMNIPSSVERRRMARHEMEPRHASRL